MPDTKRKFTDARPTTLQALDRLKSSDPAFLDAALESISAAVGCRISGIGTLTPDRAGIEILALHDREHTITPFTYPIADGPCEIVYGSSPMSPFWIYPDGVSELFDSPEFLHALGIQGYLGEAIYDASGEIFAHVFAIDVDPIEKSAETEQYFRLMSQRIGAILNQRRTEAALQRSERRYRTVIDEIADALFIHDLDGRFIDVNSQACNALGYSRDELLMLNVADIEVSIPVEIILEKWRRANIGELIVLEGTHRRQDGTLYPAEVRGRLILLDEEPAVVVCARDISTLKETETSLLGARQEAEAASRAKSDFVANMSHELRTPLNAIIGFSDILKQQHLGPIGHSRYTEYADDIHRSGQHLLRLVSDILDLSKIEAGQETLRESVFSVGQIVSDCAAILSDRARRKSIQFQIDVENPNLCLRADAVKLEQILINLLTNAVKFSFIGGNIHVTAQAMTNGGVQIAIRDSGPGIEPARIEQAFESFRRLEAATRMAVEGTGLGLPIARKLCELHGATVHLESELGTGTRAIVRMPATRVVLADQITV